MQEDELVLSDVHLLASDVELASSDLMIGPLELKVAVSKFKFVLHNSNAREPIDSLKSKGPLETDEDGDLCVRRKPTASSTYVIVIEHSLATPLNLVGLQVWSGALLLCDYMVHIKQQLMHKTLLELGGGTGICSILGSMFAQSVICTDVSPQVLEICQRNVEKNRDTCTRHGTTVLVKELDWKRPYRPNDQNVSAEKSKWLWSNEEMNIVKQVDIIIAADVIYADGLTNALFSLLRQLLNQTGRILYLSLERRLNFTLDDLNVNCPAYEHFLHCAEKLMEEDPTFVVRRIDANFPQVFKYDRTKHLEIWEMFKSR